jgi:hypothetical protein
MLIEGVERKDMGPSSHFPVLAAAVARTTGPVIEFGMGDYSTTMLHGLCRDRLLVSVESDPKWLAQFEEFRGPNHEMHLVSGAPQRAAWEQYKGIEERTDWSVALVDQWSEYRYDIALRLKGRCKFIICHDYEEVYMPSNYPSNFMWRKLDGVFKYRFVFKKYVPYTAVFSDEEEFSF